MRPEHSRDGRASETYEVHLQGSPPETLIARFAPTLVGRKPAQTVLMGRVASQDELATLLERVLALGLELNEVHELRVASHPPSASRPVAGAANGPSRVRGEGRRRARRGDCSASCDGTTATCPSRRRCGWRAPPSEVHEFLSACCRLGLGIERVRQGHGLHPNGAGIRHPELRPPSGGSGSADTQLATASDGVHPAVDAVLAEDALEVGLHGVRRHEQLGRDLLGRAHLGEQLENLGLPVGERLEHVLGRCE